MILLAAAPHRYHPFEGGHDFADAIRILLIVASFALLGFIGRAVREGITHHEMTRGQAARFLGVALIVTAVSVGVAGRFGTPIGNAVYVIIVGVGLEWYGVFAIRREQRNRTNGQHQESADVGR